MISLPTLPSKGLAFLAGIGTTKSPVSTTSLPSSLRKFAGEEVHGGGADETSYKQVVRVIIQHSGAYQAAAKRPC